MPRPWSRCSSVPLVPFMFTRDRRITRRVLIGLVVTAALITVACWPTTRSTGLNFVVSTERLPLWQKAAEFIERDDHLRTTAHLALAHVGSKDQKAFAAMTWTRANIKYAPADRPVIDDHIWNVIVRGYGQADQLADVFTTLLTYDGVPAFWQNIGRAPDFVPLSYVSIDNQWRVFDVARGVVFRNADGNLVTAAEIAADRAIVIRAAEAAKVDGISEYVSRFDGYRPPERPDILRAELQMPRRRLAFELCHAVGMTCGTTK